MSATWRVCGWFSYKFPRGKVEEVLLSRLSTVNYNC